MPGELLQMQRGEFRLGVKGIDVTGASLHEQPDHPPRPRPQVRRLGGQRPRGLGMQQGVEGQGAQRGPQAKEEFGRLGSTDMTTPALPGAATARGRGPGPFSRRRQTRWR